jgi:hypothetical protein
MESRSNGAQKHGMEKDTKGHFIQQHKQQITIVALLMCTKSSPVIALTTPKPQTLRFSSQLIIRER